MKIARVFVQDYSGRQAGDIHDVFDPADHPGSLLSGTLEEFQVDDSFDKDIMSANVHQEKWTKEGQSDVYVDPQDGTWTHETDGPYAEFYTDQTKVDAKDAADKAAQTKVAYDQMDADILTDMQAVFGTTRTDSANAFNEQWKQWSATPSDFSAQGFIALTASGGFSIGDALDDDTKVKAYADAKLAEVKQFGIDRQLRIQQYVAEKATIEAS